MRIQTGKGSISPGVLLAIWSVSAVTSLPGLAVSPILGDLNRIFPHATNLEIQMLTSLPSLLIIPFVLLSGRLSVGRDKFRTLTVGLALFFAAGLVSLFARSMAGLIAMSCLLGVGAGMVIPFSTGLVVDYFTGGYRIRQLVTVRRSATWCSWLPRPWPVTWPASTGTCPSWSISSRAFRLRWSFVFAASPPRRSRRRACS